MKLDHKSGVRGRLTVRNYGPDGALKDEREILNMVIQVGQNWIASRMKDASMAVMSHMALGSGIADPNLANTALGTELGRVVLTGSATVVGNTITYSANFTAGVATGALSEAGLFNDPAAGTMLARTTFPVVNKGAADNTVITWAITVTGA
jgi:hypothetical protein